MTQTFSTTGGLTHSQLIIGLQNGNSYIYYVRCNDTAGNVNIDDFIIQFFVLNEEYHEADLNQDGIVDYSEIIIYLNKWLNNEISLNQLLSGVNEWRKNFG